MSNKAKTITKISVLGIIGLFCTDFLYMADLGFYPSFGALMEEFYTPEPDNMGILNFAMTGSQLAAMIASFAVIPLMRRFTKKALLLVETAIFGVFALCTPLVDNIVWVATMRTCSGFGFGGLLTVGISLIQQVYRSNPKRRDSLVGLFNGMLGAGGAVNSLIGGFLAAISWDMVYNIYWIAVPVFLLILFFVPRTPADRDDEAAVAEQAELEKAKEADEKSSGGWNGTFPKVFAAMLAYCFVNIVYLAMGSGQISLYIPELGLGGAAEAGICTMASSISAILCGLIFAPLYHKMKRFMPVFFYAAMVISLIIYSMQPGSLFVLGLGFFIAAFGYAFGLSYYMVYVSETAPLTKSSTAIAMITIGMTLGAFLSPYAVTALQSILACPVVDPEMGSLALAPIYPVLLVTIIIAFVLSLILAIRSKKRGEVYGAAEPEQQVVESVEDTQQAVESAEDAQ